MDGLDEADQRLGARGSLSEHIKEQERQIASSARTIRNYESMLQRGVPPEDEVRVPILQYRTLHPVPTGLHVKYYSTANPEDLRFLIDFRTRAGNLAKEKLEDYKLQQAQRRLEAFKILREPQYGDARGRPVPLRDELIQKIIRGPSMPQESEAFSAMDLEDAI